MSNNLDEFDDDGWKIDESIELVDACTAPSGEKYVHVRQRDVSLWTKRNEFAEGGDAAQLLRQGGIVVFTAAARRKLIKEVSERTYFPPRDLAEKAGWNPVGFGYPDGRVFPFGEKEPPVAYPTGAICVTSSGTAKQWRKNVAKFVKGQFLLMFCLMAAFAAVILSLTRIQGNFLLMLSGPPRKGKTTCVDLMASVCGPALDSPDGRYYLKFNNTMNRLEEWMPPYSDLPMIIDELSSHGTKGSRMNDFRTMIHHLAGVDSRGRLGDRLAPAMQTRTIIPMTSNDTGAEMLGLETEAAAEAVEDRLLEFPVPRGAEGAFNALAADPEEARKFSDEVLARVAMYHGTAMPAFLTALVKQLHQDEAAVRNGIEKRIKRFADFPEVRAAGHVSSRKLDAIGLIYAAGRLAVHHRILPRKFDCKGAAIHCLRLHLGLRAEADPVQRVLAWAAGMKLIDLRSKALGFMSNDALQERGAFIGKRSGVTEFWIHPLLFRPTFDEHKVLLNSLKSRKVLQTDGKGDDKHKALKLSVRLDKKTVRVFALRIPDFGQWLDDHGYSERGGPRRKS